MKTRGKKRVLEGYSETDNHTATDGTDYPVAKPRAPGRAPKKSSFTGKRRSRGSGDADTSAHWGAVAIVSETETKFKIKWAGLDPDTGQPWVDSWEKKTLANKALKDDWKQWKAKNPLPRSTEREAEYEQTASGWRQKPVDQLKTQTSEISSHTNNEHLSNGAVSEPSRKRRRIVPSTSSISDSEIEQPDAPVILKPLIVPDSQSQGIGDQEDSLITLVSLPSAEKSSALVPDSGVPLLQFRSIDFSQGQQPFLNNSDNLGDLVSPKTNSDPNSSNFSSPNEFNTARQFPSIDSHLSSAVETDSVAVQVDQSLSRDFVAPSVEPPDQPSTSPEEPDSESAEDSPSQESVPSSRKDSGQDSGRDSDQQLPEQPALDTQALLETPHLPSTTETGSSQVRHLTPNIIMPNTNQQENSSPLDGSEARALRSAARTAASQASSGSRSSSTSHNKMSLSAVVNAPTASSSGSSTSITSPAVALDSHQTAQGNLSLAHREHQSSNKVSGDTTTQEAEAESSINSGTEATGAASSGSDGTVDDSGILTLPLKLSSEALQTYRDEVADQSHLLDDFLNAVTPENFDGVKRLFERLHELETHPDLIDRHHLKQVQLVGQERISWDKTMSSKFNFLGTLIEGAISTTKTIAIFAKPSLVISLIQHFLEATGVSFEIPHLYKTHHGSRGSLRVVVLPTLGYGSDMTVAGVDLAFGFDETFHPEDPRLQALRESAHPQGCLIFGLVIAFSLQHIERELAPRRLSPIHLLQKKVFLSRALIRFTGRLPHSYPRSADEAALPIVEYLQGTTTLAEDVYDLFGLPQLPPIDDGSPKVSFDVSMDESSNSGKRLRNDSIDESSARKRQRHSDPLQSSSQSSAAENTHLSEQITKAHEEAQRLHEELRVVTETLHREQLQRAVEKRDLDKALGDLQYRFEDLTDVHKKIEIELKAAQGSFANATSRIESLNTSNSSIRAENQTLKKELEAARQALATSGSPEHAEMEALRKQANEADEVKKKLENQKKDNAFITDQYQSASARAVEAANEAEQLKAEVERLRQKASGEINRLREMFAAKDLKKAASSLKKLQQENNGLTKLVRRLSGMLDDFKDENKTLKEQVDRHVGMAAVTRAGSVRASSLPPGQQPPPHQHPPNGSSLRTALGASVRSSRPASRASSRQASPMPTTRAGNSTPLHPSHLRD